MELKHLQTFKQVAKTLNFSRAAENLQYAQPTISSHIQALEKELGVMLFNRMGGQIQLTEAGKGLLAYADRMTDLEEEARKRIGQLDNAPLGDIRIGASEAILAHRLPSLVSDFQFRYPNLRLIINPVHFRDLTDAVKQGQIDLALAYREHVDPDLAFEVLFDEPLRLYVGAKHPLLEKADLSIGDLEGETLLAPSMNCPYRLLFRKVLEGRHVTMRDNYQFGSNEPIKQFASRVGGVALLAENSVRDELRRGDLVPLPLSEGKLSIPGVMVWHPDRWESAAVRALKGFIRKYFSLHASTSEPEPASRRKGET